MMAQVNAGRVRFVGRGEYNNSTQYYVFDLVSYNGNSYYAKADTIGNLPTDTTYWQLVAEKGNVGPTGLTGNGISSIEKTSTSGLVDTYTITFTNGNTTTFDVSNGNGIDRIEKTATVGNIDTYTIYFNDNSTSTFEVANGEVTREELEEEVDRLSMIYNAFPTTSNEGEEITLDGTAEVPFKKLNLKGNTSQNTTTGKNLLNMTNGTYSNNGITAVVSDGTITINGTATATSFVRFNLLASISLNDAYTLSINNGNNVVGATSPTSNYACLRFNTGTGDDTDAECYFGKVNSTKLIDKEITYTTLCIRTGNGLAYNNFVIKPQLESGSTATAYEEYTGGIPAPNPDYPQDIQVVSGDNNIKVEGKNLCNGITQNYFVNQAATRCGYAVGDSGLIIEVDGVSDYTISSNTVQTRYRVGCLNEIPVEGGSNTIVYNGSNKDGTDDSVTINTNGYKYLAVNATDLTSIQLEKNSTKTLFEEYKLQTYPINLGSMELCKIGDYQDSIVKDNGQWYLNKQIGKVVLDGSETGWGINQSSGYYRASRYFSDIYNPNDTNRHIDKIICSHFYLSIDNAIGNLFQYVQQLIFYVPSGITTLEQWKTWLSTHNTIVYYVLETPTVTEITDNTLIEQLDNLENAYSYDTQTNITQTNDDMPFILDVEALMSLKGVLN